MPRTLIAMPFVVCCVLLTGCSVLGIATKSELQTAMDQESAARTHVENQLEDLDTDLAELVDRLGPRLAGLDDELARTRAQVDEVTTHWAQLRATMASQLDSLAVQQDHVWLQLVTIREGLDSTREDLGLARADLAAVSDRTSLAWEKGRRALQFHEDELLRERERLQRRLQVLESRLVEVTTALTDTGMVELPTPPNAEAPAATEGTVEIRAVSARR